LTRLVYWEGETGEKQTNPLGVGGEKAKTENMAFFRKFRQLLITAHSGATSA
jgi:hypothetical protein